MSTMLVPHPLLTLLNGAAAGRFGSVSSVAVNVSERFCATVEDSDLQCHPPCHALAYPRIAGRCAESSGTTSAPTSKSVTKSK